MGAGLLNEFAACGRVDRPPKSCCYIDLPEDFGVRFAVFCDTEEDFDWSRPLSRENRSCTSMAKLPALQSRFVQAGVKCIYLVDHPIATDPASIDILRGFGEECTIGSQLHPWVNPPFEEEVSRANSFAGNLPIALERAKLTILTETIEAAFGRRPLVYRAGRYGVGPNSARLLRELGYRADTSVRPLFDYRKEKGPDFRAVRPLPFWVGDGDLLEIPLSVAFTGRLARRLRSLYHPTRDLPFAHMLLSRLKLLDRVPLTPEGVSPAEAIAAIRLMVAAGVRLITISFHSPSAEPGHTPFVRNAAELDRFYRWWDEVFDFLAGQGATPASLEEILAAAEAARACQSRAPSASRPDERMDQGL